MSSTKLLRSVRKSRTTTCKFKFEKFSNLYVAVTGSARRNQFGHIQGEWHCQASSRGSEDFHNGRSFTSHCRTRTSQVPVQPVGSARLPATEPANADHSQSRGTSVS